MATDAQEIERLKRWVSDLQSGMWVNCVYCGHRYGLSASTPATMASVLKQHIAICPEHPMSKLIKACMCADYTLSSLLAVRDGIPDAALKDHRDFIRKTVEDATTIEARRKEAPRETNRSESRPSPGM